MRGRSFLPAILLSLILQVTHANTGTFNVEQYNNRTGLSNSAINHLFIDRDALLWVGTWDGLNYFDGYSFQHTNYARPEKNSGISNNVVQNVSEDSNNNIWITTIGGISVYDKQSGLIHNYFYSTVPNESMGEHEYGVAVNSENNTIYAYAPKQGLMQYNASKRSFAPITLPVNCDRPIKILINNSNLYLLNTEGMLYSFKIQNNHLIHTQSLQGIKNCFIANHKLFLAETNKQISIYANDILIHKTVVPDNINAVGYYDHHYFFAWGEKGFAVYDSAFAPSSYMNEVVKEYSEIKVTAFGNNTTGSLWMGTDGNGILKITPRSQTFGTISFANLNIPYNVPVRTFCRNGNDLWMGTKGKGIIVLKNFNPSLTIHNTEYTTFSFPGQLDNNAVYALKSSAYNNLIYIGSDALGLGIFNKSNNHFYKWKNIEGANNISSFGSVYSIYEDTDSSLWLGTSGYGLIHIKFNVNNAKISISLYEKYTATGNDKGPVNNIIYSIAYGGENYLWIGCRYGGLNIFNKQKKLFKEFNRLPDDQGLSNNDVLYVYNDTGGNLWVGTSYGLNLLKHAETLRENAGVIRFITENGLPNNTIHGIIEDANNNIWVSTNKGIAKITRQGKNIINYQEADGLQNSEFSDGSVWKGFDNRLFFGGIAGFNNFEPATIKQDTYLPGLLISNLSIGGKPDNENKLLVIKQQAQTDGISQTLERKSNYFELNLKTINYDKAAKCEISYYLEGYDKTWHTEKGITKIAYSNLPVGNYQLKIKWSNGDSIWSAERVILNLTVRQYWWLTPFAFIFYGIVVAVIGYIIYKYRKDSIEEKHKLEKEK
ncbi:MAG: two-component regulator propeller domain-containing protein, partial [Niabella sp.]